MKRILVMLGVRKSETETVALPETMVDDELIRLTRRKPKTEAEREFHAWLLGWKRKLESAK